MNTNNIDNLRRMETPVTEEGWTSIVNDRRYARKFGRKPGLSPKGRAALVAGVAAVLVAVPILVKTLTHKTEETAQTTVSTTETAAKQNETATQKSATKTVAYPSATETEAITPSGANSTPAKVTVTESATAHESSTMASVTAKRQQTADNQSREDWPPVLFPEPDGSRLSYNNLKTTPKRSDVNPQTTDHNINVSATTTPTTISTDANDEIVLRSAEEEPVTETEQFFIPSAFTPNGDGLNDLFLVKANFEPKSFELTVLNRSGEMMFISRDINIGWDGQLRGKLMPQGVYVCIIKYKDSQGNEHKQQGQVLLIP